MKKYRNFFGMCILSTTLTCPVWSYADANPAVTLLNKMTQALHNLNYSGQLVFIKNNQASTLQIEHYIDGDSRKESIQPLDGQGNELIRKLKNFSLSKMPRINAAMEQSYSFDLGGMGKVAGKPCRIVLARPKDRKRFLKKFCIDERLGFLLQYTLINQEHQIVEQFMFTDISINEAHQDDDEAQRINPHGTEQLLIDQDTANNAMPPMTSNGQPDNYSTWLFDPLPSGFKVIKTERNPDNKEQIILSDGLSVISVFVANTDDGNSNPLPIANSSGALNIISIPKHNQLITIVGDVPETTLMEIFNAIKKANLQ